MKETYICDANIALRFLLYDNPEQSPIAKKLFSRAEAGEFDLLFTTSGIAEITWVCLSYYKLKKVDVANALTLLLQQQGIRIAKKHIVMSALQDFSEKNVDFLDAYQAQLAIHTNTQVLSFDADFKKWSKLNWKQPKLI